MEILREYMSQEEAASPKAIVESIFLMPLIDSKEGSDVMVADFPNAFVQTEVNYQPTEERIMKIRGPLVSMLEI
jgi:hypothetical protein